MNLNGRDDRHKTRAITALLLMLGMYCFTMQSYIQKILQIVS